MGTEHLLGLVIATMTTLTTMAPGIVKAAGIAIRILSAGLADKMRIRAETEQQVRLARTNTDEAFRLGWADASAREQIVRLSLAHSGAHEPGTGSARDADGLGDGPAASDTP